MMTEWDGHERRKLTEDGRQGRRPYDQHCGQHKILWEHNEADKKEHRGLVCGKISKLDEELEREVEKLEIAIAEIRKTIIGKYWFHFVVSFLVASIIGLGLQQNWAFKEILENQRDFSLTVNSIENKQIEAVNRISTIEGEVQKLNNRQDILRDQNIKILEKR